MPLFFGQLDMTSLQFPETGPEVAAGKIFKFTKNRKFTLFETRRTMLRPGISLTSIHVCPPNQATDGSLVLYIVEEIARDANFRAASAEKSRI